MMPLALAAAAAFNLICSGTTHSSQTTLTGMETYPDLPFNQVFRIDMDRKRWCTRKCTETQPIFEVSPEMIKLDEEIRGRDDDTMEFFNRENGIYGYRDRRWVGAAMFVSWAQGTCKRAPFSGFPARKF